MENRNDFDIENGILTKYWGSDEFVVIPEGVVTVGENAFRGCEGVKRVVLPRSVRRIAEGAFSDCRDLEEAAVPESVTEIGRLVFSGCKSLRNAVIPRGMTEIADSMFSFCRSLENLVIPDHVTKIGKDAFRGTHKKAVVTCAKSKIKKYTKLLQNAGLSKKAKFQPFYK